MDVEIIQLIPISQTNQPDFWAWQYDKMGIFSVRSAYKMMEEAKRRRVDWLEGREASSNVEGEDASWKKLWKLKVPSKLRIFAWRNTSVRLSERRKNLPNQERADAKWLPPDVGFCKINVDGAVAKSCFRGAAGAVCRDERGRFLGASVVVYAGVIDPTMLEAYTCKEALELAEDLSQHKLMITSDCLNVINDIRAKSYKGYYCMILRDIEQRRVSFQATKYGHEQREANGEAHRLGWLPL
nr:uncharacterized protein LOC127315346 [Lolium perenne]